MVQIKSLRPYQKDAMRVFMGADYAAKVPTYDATDAHRATKRAIASKMKGASLALPDPPKQVHPPGGIFVWPTGGTVTGRASGSQPNAQRMKTYQYITSNTVNSTATTTMNAAYINQMKQAMSKMWTNQTSSMITGKSCSTTSIYDDLYTLDDWSMPIKKELEKLRAGRKYNLPDGSQIVIDLQGNYTIQDENAKITYRANRLREFNRYINSSDLLEEFIGYLGTMGVRRKELADLPISLFVHWLIIRAAEADGEDVPQEERDLLEQDMRAVSFEKCAYCHGLIPLDLRKMQSRFCSGSHMDAFRTRPFREQQLVLTEQAALVE